MNSLNRSGLGKSAVSFVYILWIILTDLAQATVVQFAYLIWILLTDLA